MSNWLTIDDEDCVIVVPETDILPHGTVLVEEGKMELGGMDCPCKPKTVVGDKDGIYDKPVIIHNSFEQMKKVEESMERLGH